MRLAVCLALPLLALAACKPPPSDEAATGRVFSDKPDAPPAPLESPDSEGAFWANSEEAGRIIYGQAGKAPLMAMQCIGDPKVPLLQVTRLSPADKGGKAFFALVGNSHVARIAVDATEVPGGFVWQGTIPANHPDLEALTGPKEVTATLPGAGMVTLNPAQDGAISAAKLVNDCRALALPKPSLDILEVGDPVAEANEPALVDDNAPKDAVSQPAE